jgi:hypothetical protein
LIETTLFTPLIFIFQEKFSSDPFFFDERIAFVHRGCVPGRTHFPSAARPAFDILACNTDYSIHPGPQAAPCGRLTLRRRHRNLTKKSSNVYGPCEQADFNNIHRFLTFEYDHPKKGTTFAFTLFEINDRFRSDPIARMCPSTHRHTSRTGIGPGTGGSG